jgi:outer membrane protein OmpA-like peptidoglycan-associated protein
VRTFVTAALAATWLLLGLFVAAPARAEDAQVVITITNGDQDMSGKARFELHPAGKHDSAVVAWAAGGEPVTVPAGSYDAEAIFEDGAAQKRIWLNGLAVSGTVEKSVEIGLPVASATYRITNQGEDVEGRGQFEVHAAGKHDGPVLTWAASGNEVRLPAGSYDVELTFEDGAAKKHVWLDGQKLSGKVEQAVEMGVKVAAVTYRITNQGEDVEGKGRFEIHAAGKHDGPVLTWGASGNEVRLPEGTYDVELIFEDGEANRHIWLDGQQLAGKVEQAVDVGVKVASAKYHITNQGEDVEGKGRFEIHAAGKHDGPVLTWGASGNEVRLPDGDYDVAAIFETGMVAKTKWLDRQHLTGRVDQTVEMGVAFAEPTVTATLNGADVGDKARIGFIPAGKSDEIGAIASGETAQLEAGAYDLVATIPGAEGALRKVAISGKPRLVVPLQALKTAELKPGGPPPKECTIEVYGVNFDFDKAVLRPESEPVLQAVLKLFIATPSFSAEVGGHTDNVGKPDYNLKLSEARAAAVKAWLVAHGVAATRVTSRGYGDTHPLVENDNDENRAKNRRVELRRQNCH